MSSLYIHIPFCIQKCLYFDFVSFAEKDVIYIISICKYKNIKKTKIKIKKHLTDMLSSVILRIEISTRH